jgi:hypothetical protein
MVFNVGDWVRIDNELLDSESEEKWNGKIGIIIKIQIDPYFHPYHVQFFKDREHSTIRFFRNFELQLFDRPD